MVSARNGRKPNERIGTAARLHYDGLHPSLHKFRVMKDAGHRPVLKHQAGHRDGAPAALSLLDVSVVPNVTVFRDGRLLEHGEK